MDLFERLGTLVCKKCSAPKLTVRLLLIETFVRQKIGQNQGHEKEVKFSFIMTKPHINDLIGHKSGTF